MAYRITYANGDPSTEHATYEAAKDAIEVEWPDCEIGHDGDLEDGGDRTLCWACEEESVDDDGARAVASIYRVLPSAGDRVCAGEPGTQDYDEGRVVSLDDSTAIVSWDSGIRTEALISDLTVI